MNLNKKNLTKIVATIGPASNSPAMIKKLILEGVNVARLNFSHGSHESHLQVMNLIRKTAKDLDLPVAILLDLQGPKIRVGKLKNPQGVLLKKGAQIEITTKEILGDNRVISTTYKNLLKDVVAGKDILLDDGLIRLHIVKKQKDRILCKIIQGGLLKENKGINLPRINVSADSLSEKDKKDVLFGIKHGVDYFALSFVRKAKDVELLKNLIKSKKTFIPIISKIEKPEALDDIDNIIEVSDGVMVARGDLGVELSPEEVPIAQKTIIHKAIYANRIVITATQMLESMCNNPIPTRAEASDVANAIIDGSDAVMLSGETASGDYPIEAVRTMKNIILKLQDSPFMKYNLQFEKDDKQKITHAIAQSSSNVLTEVDAKGIITFSLSGKTGKLISKQRPGKPIWLFTPDEKSYNRLALLWGVIPLYLPVINDPQIMLKRGEEIILKRRYATKKDLVVVVTGLAMKAGKTNVIKLHQMGDE